MKTHRLITTLALLLSATAFAAETKSSSSVTINTSDGKGKAVITIDINGKKETREIDLGNATSIEIRTDAPETKKERVTYLGIALAPLPSALAGQLGLETTMGFVASVVPGSPAEKAGLQKNDVLIRLDDEPLGDMSQLEKLISARKEGDRITLHYIRRAQPGTTEVTLGSEERDAHPLKGALLNLGTKTINASAQAALSGLLEKLGDGVTVSGKAIIIGPDGKVIDQPDPAKQLHEAAQSVEKALRDAKIGEKTLDAVRDALNDAVNALDQARGGQVDGKEVAEIARQAVNEAREKAEQIKREVEEGVRRATEEAAKKSAPQAPIEKSR